MFQKIGEQECKLVGSKETDLFPRLEPGVYNAKLVRQMFSKYFSFEPVNRYKNFKEPSKGVFSDALTHINKFFDASYRKLRHDMGMVNKINLIFNGLPGTGKTHLACVLGEKMVRDHDAVALVINDIEDIDFAKLIDDIRINDPERMIVIILDEMEKNYKSELKSSKFLGFLDGANTRENVICIGTSNDIDDLPDYLINRPGRFEKIYNFDFKGNRDMIESTLENLLTDELFNDKDLVNHIIDKAISKGIETIDHLRFMALEEIYAYQNGTEVEEDSSQEVEKKEPAKAEKDAATKSIEGFLAQMGMNERDIETQMERMLN